MAANGKPVTDALRHVGPLSLDPAEPVLLRLDGVQPEPVRWLWQLWLAEGTIAILDGDPGLGKSSLTLDLAARITTGRAMPPLEGPDRGLSPAGVLLLGAEDSLKHTVRPRLDAAAADPELVWSLEAVRQGESDRPVMLPHDLELVASFITARQIRLVVIDPLTAFLGSEYDIHKDQDVRRALRPLSKLTEGLGTVILALRHLNKLSGGPALYRGGASIAITGNARTSLIVGRDPADEDRFVLCMNKTNLGPKPVSLAYRIEAAGMACRVAWEGEVDLRADEVVGPPPRARGRPNDERQEAERFLADLLADGPVDAAVIRRRANTAGIAWRTVERAKRTLDIKSRKQGKTWIWELGKEVRQNPVPGPEEDDLPFGD